MHLWNQLPDSFRQPRHSHVSTHLLIHVSDESGNDNRDELTVSAHLYYHYHSRHPSLLHSFTPGSKPTFQQILPTLDFFTYRTAFMTTRLDRSIILIVLFLVSHFNLLFVPCGGLSWLPVSLLLHVKYTLSYHIVCILLSCNMA